MGKILVISGHPDHKSSMANRAILDEFHRLVPEAEIVSLDAIYPDFNIDVEREQRRLVEADTVVFEFPFWWYSAPSLMHRYFELVLSHGFAYGSAGTALHGKKVMFSFTAGAPEAAYAPDGYQHYDIDAFIPQFHALANLCGFIWQEPIVSFGMMLLNPDDKDAADRFYAETKSHAANLAKAVTA
ncbi:MAG: NAD(P)H-dependent oxidoreductase [Muribaculaceae bacterium]|nr:NAD(P)H-dependent oxidoreductase [Muribaculaceae bacterium]